MLTVSNLNVTLSGKPILKGLSFATPVGWFGILGINGSGKTTLLKALCARWPLTSGSIVFNGNDMTKDDAARAATFGFAPPVETLPVGLKGGEVIRLLADLRGCDAAEPKAIYQALGVAKLNDVLIGKMSSGMKQRISVFCAFLGEPDLVLLDEPFNWLDPVAAYDLKAAIRAYADHHIVITALHDVPTFASRCDCGILLHDGQVLRTFDQNDLKGRDFGTLEDEIYRLFPR